ncbi:MAG: FAD-dependent oxidoreductase [Oscillospiraceae bacterium]|nr:FAD-dependent oxidoreductase [Oscillospiraceae bacterium]
MSETLCLTINGREVLGKTGNTILQVALDNGIHIPHLCGQTCLEPFGACGLCLVEPEGGGRLLRACSTPVGEGMTVDSETLRVRRARRMALELLLSDHDGDCVGPCALACPAHVDCQGFLRAVAHGDLRQAAAVLLDRLPLPASTGRVCTHPCEAACRRRLVEAPLSIAGLQVFAAEANLRAPQPVRPRVSPATGRSVAVVGGGPCGLSAACFLARMGHLVTLFDALPQMGGTLRTAVSSARLPQDVLDLEIAEIEALGVQFVPGHRISSGQELSDLQSGYDAVLLAIGAGTAASGIADGLLPPRDTAARRVGPDILPELPRTTAGRFAVEPSSYRVSLEGVFAAGDAAGRGVSHAAAAIGQAAAASAAIDAFLRGVSPPRPAAPRSRRSVSSGGLQTVEHRPRANCPADGFSPEAAQAEALRCLSCGCSAYPSCGLLHELDAEQIRLGRLGDPPQRDGPQPRPGAVLYDRSKCILCGQCVRVCHEQAKQDLLDFAARGFDTSIRAVPSYPGQEAVCQSCRRCVEICPTGALRPAPEGGP